MLEAVRVEHVRLHLREDGEAWTVAGYRTAWQREMTFGVVEHSGPDGPAFDPGLSAEDRAKAEAMAAARRRAGLSRAAKNAVNALRRSGAPRMRSRPSSNEPA